MDIVVIVAENSLSNWCSDIGKAGHHTVINMWDPNPSGFSPPEDRAEYIAENLKNFQFLYKFPEMTRGRGAFCSYLIARVFALHLHKISTGRLVAHVPQIGRLALAAAAVECGLSIFKTGQDALKLKRDPETGKSTPCNIQGFGFTDNLWSNKVWEFVKTTTQLMDKHWEEIIEHAANFMSIHILDSDDKNIANNNGDIKTAAPNLGSLDMVLSKEIISFIHKSTLWLRFLKNWV
ncbi:hypothetical protein BJY52DRAFT_1195866 [Lactarius psammicola]|nr:hypothetical protein BJY52DRAFT_1195866 [Lactarius psammicola]